jgi:hypothetical protein
MRNSSLTPRNPRGRMTFSQDEWKDIKEAVDAHHADTSDEAARDTLADYNLWDWNEEQLDQPALTKFYMEFA